MRSVREQERALRGSKSGGASGRSLQDRAGRWRLFRPPPDVRSGPYLLQLASSTIQLTSSANESPACAASSGTSEVAVMPGCVLTSRQTTSPDPPGVSSKRKSARETPRQPNASMSRQALTSAPIRKHLMKPAPAAGGASRRARTWPRSCRSRAPRPGTISMTPSARSPITAQVSSRPGMKRSASSSSPKAQPGSFSSCGGCCVVLAHDEDADARAFRDRLQDVGPRQHVRLGRFGCRATTLPSGTGMPAARITSLARSLCMASAEASTPECV